jgi:DNA polymerase delta subunit 1
MNWIEVPAGTYDLYKKHTSHCQIELTMKYVVLYVFTHYLLVSRWNTFISHSADGEWSDLAPLRILSFDIECAGRKGIFPEAQVDPIIQIANMVTRQGLFVSHT